jgi:hypothetical protein
MYGQDTVINPSFNGYFNNWTITTDPRSFASPTFYVQDTVYYPDNQILYYYHYLENAPKYFAVVHPRMEAFLSESRV